MYYGRSLTHSIENHAFVIANSACVRACSAGTCLDVESSSLLHKRRGAAHGIGGLPPFGARTRNSRIGLGLREERDKIMHIFKSPSGAHQACYSTRRVDEDVVTARKHGTLWHAYNIQRHISKSSGSLAFSCKRRDTQTILTSTSTTTGSSCGLLLRFLADIVVSYVETLNPAI